MADRHGSARLAGLPKRSIELLQASTQLLQRGDRQQALQYVRRVAEQFPDHPEVQRYLAAALVAFGPSEESLALVEQVLRAYPNDAVVLSTHAIVLQVNGRLEQALNSFRKASQLQPQSTAHAYNLGRALSNIGEEDESLRVLEQVLRLEPTHHHARATLAEVLRRLGRTSNAIAHYRTLVQQNPHDAKAWAALSMIGASMLGDDDVTAMEQIASNPRLGPDERVQTAFALGKVYQSRSRYDSAFAWFRLGNQIVRSRVAWDIARHSDFVSSILSAFPRRGAVSDKAAGNEVIFIVSLPRSGSTLTEQMLAAHPLVDAGQEHTVLLQTIAAEERRRGHPLIQWAAEATADDWCRLGKQYLARVSHWRDRGTHITDKLPGNWLWLGAALAMLPGAHVIDCRRDLLETAWSCYCHLFHIGTQDFSYDFKSIAAFARDHDRAMRHWLQLYPDRVKTHTYESLVADPEGVMRQTLSFCGLDFDPSCLRYHEVGGSVRTASAGQVREPIRRDTARAHQYGALLDPLRKALGMPPFAAT